MVPELLLSSSETTEKKKKIPLYNTVYNQYLHLFD